MTAVAAHSPPGFAPPGFPGRAMAALHSTIERAIENADEQYSAAELIDQIAQIGLLRNSLAALQATTMRAFARAHAESRIAAGQTDPEKIERGIAAQIGLACRVSPTEGRKRVRVARDLYDGLEHVRRLFAAGELSARKLTAIVSATSGLDRAERGAVDGLLARESFDGHGIRALRDLTLKAVAQVAPEKFLARHTVARGNRRVTLRPSADGTTDLIAHLPAEQGAACYAALCRAYKDASVSPDPLTRGRGQVMADTLVERLTGQATADAVNVQIQVMVPVEALVDPSCPLPAEIPGHGPVPTHFWPPRRAGKRGDI